MNLDEIDCFFSEMGAFGRRFFSNFDLRILQRNFGEDWYARNEIFCESFDWVIDCTLSGWGIKGLGKQMSWVEVFSAHSLSKFFQRASFSMISSKFRYLAFLFPCSSSSRHEKVRKSLLIISSILQILINYVNLQRFSTLMLCGVCSCFDFV